MHNRGVDFEQIQDLLAFRIITGNITECYKCLGIIHSTFTPVPGRFKDYIAIPKVNNYQSLHTTVIGPGGERIEIQIRTNEMHEIAETGVAAHWMYKEGKKPKNLQWVEELMEYNRDIKQSSEFMDVVKNDLDIGGIFVFTPDGDVRELRHGATPLDFAYSVHTDVGNRCVGAKVNGKMVPLKYRLKSGDSVEVLTSKTQNPSKDWLKIVKTSRARTKIKQYLLKVERERNREVGTEILEKALKSYGTNLKTLEKKSEFSKVFDNFNIKDVNELYLHLGSGRFSIKQILELIPSIDVAEDKDVGTQEKRKKEFDTLYKEISSTAKKTSNRDNAVIVDGLDDIVVRMGKCCNPIPGDPIVGFITRGRGITIHTKTCQRVLEFEESRKIYVEWNSAYSFKHPVSLRVITHDRPGTLSRITNNIHGHGINIKSAIAKSLPDMKGSFLFEIEVKDYSEYLKVVSLIEAMEEIISVTRA